MKQLLAALLLAALSTAALADSPEAILKDYQKQSAAALGKLNETLEKATTPLIASLISSGDSTGAGQLTEQLKAKLAGEMVPSPQASATLLFAQYDQARAKALEPVQKAGFARIDSLLKITTSAPRLETVTELAKVRAEIEAGGGGAGPASPIPEQWTYHATVKPDGSVGPAHGELHFHPDGTVTIKDFANPKIPHSGSWKANVKGDKVVISVQDFGDWKLELKGPAGTLDRPEAASPDHVYGLRYLRVKAPKA